MSSEHGNQDTIARAITAVVNSGRGTPETPMSYSTPNGRQTTFSSISGRYDNSAQGTPSRMFPGDARLSGFGHDGGDPFTESGGNVKAGDHKLSPTALNFKPYSLNVTGNANIGLGIAINGFESPDSGPSQQEQVRMGARQYSSPSNSQDSGITQSGSFSTDGPTTRVVKLARIYSDVNVPQLEATLEKQKESGAILRGSRQKFRVGDAMYLRFKDIRDSQGAYSFIKVECPGWQVEFVDPGEVSQLRGDGQVISKHEGQVYMLATFPSTGSFNRPLMEETLRSTFEAVGELYAFQKQLGTGAGRFQLIAEFCNVDAATLAVEKLNGQLVGAISIEVGFNVPDIVDGHKIAPITPVRPKNVQDGGLTDSMARLGFNGSYTPQIRGSDYTVLSPTTRTFLNSTAPVATPPYQALQYPNSQYETPQYQMVSRGTPSYGYPTTPAGYYTPSPVLFNPYGQMNGQFNGQFATTYHQNNYVAPPGLRALPWTVPIPYAGRFNYGSPNALVHAPGRVYTNGGYNPMMTPSNGGYRRRPANGSTRHGDGSTNPSHNVVDLDKISKGVDVRTTIMLRNIPNKIDQVMLKQIVDESSFGQYDFMYLRIDFANNCNVGYAFINFEDPYHIIDFVTARAGQRWNKFNSDKIAEVSYATIQGKDCLVQKFRNSSVMLEHPSFRPKIFFTQGHPQVGQEEEFAGPDNPSKMRRSVENAEHVGLFAPRAGQHYRDEQRRRKSKYDRGTRLAEMEENEYELEGGNMGQYLEYQEQCNDLQFQAQYQAYARAQAQFSGQAYDAHN